MEYMTFILIVEGLNEVLDNDNTDVTMRDNISYNPTLDENYLLPSYTQYDTISTITEKDGNCQNNYLGSFMLDTITRDVEFTVSIHKPLEYWLHSSNVVGK